MIHYYHKRLKGEIVMNDLKELLQKKETEFMHQYLNMELWEILEELSIDSLHICYKDLQNLFHNLEEAFVFYLLQDSTFLNIHIVSHFYEECGVHIFGLELLDVHEPCKSCDDVTSEWTALVIDTYSKTVTLDFCEKCLDSESVEDSRYRGKPLKSILSLIYSDYSAEIIE